MTSTAPAEAGPFLQHLERVIADRKSGDSGSGYTASLFAAGTTRIAQKVGEEGVELAIAGALGDRQAIISEAADLLFHTLVLLSAREIALTDVIGELQRRHR